MRELVPCGQSCLVYRTDLFTVQSADSRHDFQAGFQHGVCSFISAIARLFLAKQERTSLRRLPTSTSSCFAHVDFLLLRLSRRPDRIASL